MRIKHHKQIEAWVKQHCLPPRLHWWWRAQRALRHGEPELQLLHRLVDPNKACIDVGVYRGVYTYCMAKLCNQVFAFEPNPHSFAEAQRYVTSKVTLLPYALSNQTGSATLNLPVRNANAELAGEKFHMGCGTLAATSQTTEALEIETRRLDDLDLPPIGLIKIDVEGHEMAVLEGAKALIEHDHPNLLIEIEQRHTGQPIETSLQQVLDLGYQGFFFLADQGLQPLSDFNPQQHHQPDQQPYINNFVFKSAE